MKNDAVHYLIMGIGFPVFTQPPAPHEESAREAGEKLECAISPVYLLRGNHVPKKDECSREDGRYMLTFSSGVADHQRARQIADALALSFTLLEGPLFSLDDLARIYPFPAGMLQDDGYLFVDKLLAYDRSLPFEERFGPVELQLALAKSIHIGEGQMVRVWALVPVVAEEPLSRALRFLEASFREFYVFPGEVPEVLGRPEETPMNADSQTRAENALLNAYKAVEALIGDLPKDEGKYLEKLKNIGVDPFRQVGYETSLLLHRRIRELNRVRNKKSAHGSTSNRRITYYDLMDFQLCARLVVIGALEQKLGHRIFD